MPFFYVLLFGSKTKLSRSKNKTFLIKNYRCCRLQNHCMGPVVVLHRRAAADAQPPCTEP